MKSIFEETQRERDEELARYLGIPVEGVEGCAFDSQFGPPVYEGVDFRAPSYNHIYEEYGRKNPATVLRALANFNVVKRKRLVYGARQWVGRPRGRQFLDFGCGVGGHGIHFLQCGAKVDFLDVNGPVYEYAHWRVRERGLESRARFMFPGSDLPESFYDVVLCIDVLEHTADPVMEFRRILQATRRDAVVILQFGNHLSTKQAHFKQSKGRWHNSETRAFLRKSLKPLVPGRYCYYFRKR